MEKENPEIVFNWRNIALVGSLVIVVLAIVTALMANYEAPASLERSDQPLSQELSQEFNDIDLSEQVSQEIIMDNNNVQELQIEDITIGDGAEATPGKEVVVHYTGTLLNGKKFDSSLDRGEPFTFNLGAGRVIQGWDMGVAGMKTGGKRKLVIPPHLGYGDRGVGADIPPNSTLIFEVELLEVK
jgi:FKBP-type peptidyl-prolyl cis-trans isomerase FkpA